MIACDTSSLINFLQASGGADAELVRSALRRDALWLPPPVRTELLSRPFAGLSATDILSGAKLIPLADGFWDRAGHNRRILIGKGLKAKLADALIAQCCIDADIPLITSDTDFRQFERWCGLKLA